MPGVQQKSAEIVLRFVQSFVQIHTHRDLWLPLNRHLAGINQFGRFLLDDFDQFVFGHILHLKHHFPAQMVAFRNFPDAQTYDVTVGRVN
jgi:hypothetical protein